MEKFIKGDIIIIPFPFSDLSGSKRRPAMVLADDILLCQITSQQSNDHCAIALKITDFVEGSLPVSSFIRPLRIFTADKNIIIRKQGRIKQSLLEKVFNVIIDTLKNE